MTETESFEGLHANLLAKRDLRQRLKCQITVAPRVIRSRSRRLSAKRCAAAGTNPRASSRSFGPPSGPSGSLWAACTSTYLFQGVSGTGEGGITKVTGAVEPVDTQVVMMSTW